ncbi:BTAD domain-containing putative transcriptional regulator [Actinosynnema sp. NPDC050801]|uniref:AfsR/SARP family transcriptional regulator n=1 Tax=unclassified Actinosynnema TaxID=2637065 RepID=UPI0033EA3D1D
MPATCQVRVLGRFSVSVDGRPVPGNVWRNRRAADVVKLLAVEPDHRLHREQVMDRLWPDLPVDAAGANLRKALYYARRALGRADAVRCEGRLLTLWPVGVLDVDLDRFERAADAALASGDATRCALAAAEYRGGLLADDRYECWVAEPHEKVEGRYVALLRAAGDWARLLELDETDEQAHRAVMRRHLAAGNRREALRQFDRLRRTLRERIGVGPDAETIALYESALAVDAAEPPSPSQRAAVALANGLVAFGRRHLAEAERLARQVRVLALDADLGHELGEASTLLALVAHARGTWHRLFREEFADSVRHPTRPEVYDAHLCFQEIYLYGPEGHDGAEAFGRDLLDIASRAGSAAGRALALLLLGEFALLSGHLDTAVATLRESLCEAERAGCVSAQSLALERLAEAASRRGNRAAARADLDRALPLARSSGIPSHLVIRVHGVRVQAADSLGGALSAIREAERWLTEAPHVCDPCSMGFRIAAATACACAGSPSRARPHLVEAERISGLWQGGQWSAALWEVRAQVRRAQGQRTQAAALFLEAAERFAAMRRPLEERRCRAAAAGCPPTGLSGP